MIYLDTSVVLAHLLVGDRRPPRTLWREALFSSRFARVRGPVRSPHALAHACGDRARERLPRVAMIEPSPLVLARALEPFPVPVRTLDALHLASLDFLHERRLLPRLASYDQRMLRAARAMQMAILDLD